MTANAFVKDVHVALDAGMNAHIAKPLNLETLKSTLGSCLPKNKTAEKNPAQYRTTRSVRAGIFDLFTF